MSDAVELLPEFWNLCKSASVQQLLAFLSQRVVPELRASAASAKESAEKKRPSRSCHQNRREKLPRTEQPSTDARGDEEPSVQVTGSLPPVQGTGSLPPVQGTGSLPPVQETGSLPPVQETGEKVVVGDEAHESSTSKSAEEDDVVEEALEVPWLLTDRKGDSEKPAHQREAAEAADAPAANAPAANAPAAADDGSKPVRSARPSPLEEVLEGDADLRQRLRNFVGAKDALNRQAIHLAASTGNAKVVRLLLAPLADARPLADVHAQAQDGEQALHFGARAGDLETVKTLLKAGARVNAASARGAKTAMYYAERKKHDALVDFLVSKGGRVRAQMSVDEVWSRLEPRNC